MSLGNISRPWKKYWIAAFGVVFLSLSAGAMDHSISPIAGYSATYSLVLGGGYFFKNETTKGRLIGVYTLSGAFQFQPKLEAHLTDWLESETDITLQKGFEPYYGEGPNTAVGERRDIKSYRSESLSGFRFHLSDKFSFGPRVGLRTYHAEDANNPFNPTGNRLISPSVGMHLRYDARGKAEKQDEGFLHETELWYSPGWSEATDAHFGTGEVRFTEGITPFGNTRILLTANMGTSFGEPDYAYRFRLGGSTKLRGYLDNRFRGKNFYLFGTELRVPFSGMFAGALFGEVGEATDTFHEFHPKGLYGLGLRIALPPDKVQYARIDVGFGQDSWALYADFGFPF